MSKSLGNVIEPRQLVEAFGLDQVRYFLLREKPFGGDGTLSHQALITRINVELANDLGNLAQRSLSLIARNCDGRLPGRGAATADDAELLAMAEALPGGVRDGSSARSSTRRWRKSGRSFVPPTAISTARRHGHSAGRTRPYG